jgi:signal transduction histidine kinase
LERGLNNIAVTATRVASQVEELMDIASLQAGQVLKLNQTPRDLLPLVQRVVESCQQLSTWHTITLTTTEEHLRCHVDELRLERVFGNLLTNAIKYSPQGGDVQVRVVQETHEGQTWAVLSITDHGVGIPGEDLPTIFDAFRRGSNVSNSIAGTGLGLASARQIIEQHGGTIAVQSEVEAGSTFTIWLPSLDT